MESVPMLIALMCYGVSTVLYLLYLSNLTTRTLSWARWSLAVAAVVHFGAIGWHHAQGLPPAILSAPGLLGLGVFTLVAIFVVANLFVRTSVAGAFLAPIATVILATIVNNTAMGPAANHLEWVRFVTPVHIVTSALGFCSFGVAFLAAALLVVADQRLRERKVNRFPRLPSVATLENVVFWAIRAGFPFYTIGLVLGAVWAYWGGDGSALIPEYKLGVAVWVLYGVLVYLSIVTGWRGRKAAVLTMIGFLATLPMVMHYALRRFG